MITPYRYSEHVQGANESTRDMYADRRPDGEDMAALRGGWQERETRRAIAIPSTRGGTGAESGSALAAVSSSAVVAHSVFFVSGTTRQPRQQAPCTIRPGFLTFGNFFCGNDGISSEGYLSATAGSARLRRLRDASGSW